MQGEADGIVTCPLHKEGLRAAGVAHPGHTEILAERTGTEEFAMVLYGDGLAVAHVTLHMALRDVVRQPHHRRPCWRRSACSTACCRAARPQAADRAWRR